MVDTIKKTWVESNFGSYTNIFVKKEDFRREFNDISKRRFLSQIFLYSFNDFSRDFLKCIWYIQRYLTIALSYMVKQSYRIEAFSMGMYTRMMPTVF